MYVDQKTLGEFRLLPSSKYRDIIKRSVSSDIRNPSPRRPSNQLVRNTESETAFSPENALSLKHITSTSNQFSPANIGHTASVPVDLNLLQDTNPEVDVHSDVPLGSTEATARTPVQIIVTSATDAGATNGLGVGIAGDYVRVESLAPSSLTLAEVNNNLRKMVVQENQEITASRRGSPYRLSIGSLEIIPVRRRSSAANAALQRRRESNSLRAAGKETRSRGNSELRSRMNTASDVIPAETDRATLEAKVRCIGRSRCPAPERRSLGKLVKTYGTCSIIYKINITIFLLNTVFVSCDSKH